MQEQPFSACYTLGTSIDSFAPGHYARVFEAHDLTANRLVAFKVMRAEHLTADGQPRWESNAFPHEADLLNRLAGIPAVIRLYDCGYVESEDDPPRVGQIASFGMDSAAFRTSLPDYLKRRWRPYLALESLPRTQNLLYLMKPNSPGTRWRLPAEEGLELAMQFADLLQVAHGQRIVYLDHKLEHVYWDGLRLRVIDWNSSRLIGPNDSALPSQIQSDIHHLSVGVLYSIFTGLSPQKGSLVPQPSDQPGVEGRYADVQHLDFGVEPGLSMALQTLLEQSARQQVTTVGQLIAGLSQAGLDYGWGALDGVRTQVRTGLRRLRQGQEALREARDLLRDAAVMDDVTDEQDYELRRLLAHLNEMLSARAIP